MAHKNHDEVSEVILALRELQLLSKDNLQELPAIANKVNATLLQLDNFLSHLIGVPLQKIEPTKKFGPIKMEPRPALPENEIKSAAAMEADQLRHEVDEIFPDFPHRDPAELLDSLTEMQVRAVAKRAGIKVTEEDPERITLAFVKEIQQKILADREHKNIIEASQPKTAEIVNKKKRAV
jgi:hypothetical protein